MFNSRLVLAGCLLIVAGASKAPDARELRTRIKTRLNVPDPLPALRDKSYGQLAVTPDIAADRVSYATGYEMRVPALIYHKAGATVMQHPALLLVSENGDDKASPAVYGAGIRYARAGAVVLTYDPIGLYERDMERRPVAVLGSLPDDLALRLKGLSVTDVLQGVQYLASRKDVDAQRIAVVGSLLACALDVTIRGCARAADDDLDGPAQDWGFKRGTILTGDGVRDQKTLALWLNDRLKFPGWSKKQIEGMSDKDEPTPGIARKDLHALPDAVWMAEKEAYVYQSWAERARAALKVR